MGDSHEFRLDQEIEDNLAKLPQQRASISWQRFNLQRELGKKREDRRALAKLSPTKKTSYLEELRIRNNTARLSPNASPSDSNILVKTRNWRFK